MVTPSKAAEENEGSKRAADFHNAMLSQPGYADDTMFFVMRFMASVKQKLRECDSEEFFECYHQFNKLWGEGQEPEAPGGSASRYERQQELRGRALEIIKDYPELVRDFDRFLTNGRSVFRTLVSMRQEK
ncbi:hypothetical protein B0J13DRAFT_541595 [Dactylonectria estremocensis]|uniref:Uncharacterized protein n=1 Tax=Dactylonectria estremocensis TaxID=1079267 RepID=A0A9P9FBC0_9HYPO|nr:hypothetical protein B0J13DRAFT_541595 [Dactylonectria estremocensis]